MTIGENYLGNLCCRFCTISFIYSKEGEPLCNVSLLSRDLFSRVLVVQMASPLTYGYINLTLPKHYNDGALPIGPPFFGFYFFYSMRFFYSFCSG